MAQKITQAAEVELSINGLDSVAQINKELKEAKDKAFGLAREFGELSPEALKAAQEVAKLKREMSDFNKKVDDLNPSKFSQITKLATGVASGFAAAQGAAVLFGGESEKVQQTLIKVQAAMALAQGLKGISEAKEAFSTFAVLLKGKVVSALTTVKGASRALGGALGIGLLLIAINFLIEHFGTIVKVAQKIINIIPGMTYVIDKLSEAWDWVSSKISVFTDSIGLTTVAMDKYKKKVDEAILSLTRLADLQDARGEDSFMTRRRALIAEIAMLRRIGGEEEKVAQKRHELNVMDAKRATEIANKKSEDAKKKAAKDAADAEKASQKAKAKQDKLNEQRRANEKAAQSALDEIREQTGSKREVELKELQTWYDKQAKVLKNGGKGLNELDALRIQKEREMKASWQKEDLEKELAHNKKILAAKKKAEQDFLKQGEEEFKKTQQNTNDYFGRLNIDLINDLANKRITQKQFDQEQELLQTAKLQKQLQDAIDYGLSTVDIETRIGQLKLNQQKNQSDEAIRAAEIEREARLMIANSIVDGLVSLGSILTSQEKERNKIAKAAALAQIAIDTAQAFSALVRNSESNPSNAVTSGLAGIAQFAAGAARIITNIAKAKDLLTSKGNVSVSASSGSPSVNVPQFQDVTQNINVQRLDYGTKADGKGGVQRVILVESDKREHNRRVALVDGEGSL
jgi:hypothetical protein